jgi:hypothetical protein
LTRARFRLLRFRSPLLTESLFLRVLRCFSSPGAPCPAYVFSRECLDMTPDGLPHSDIAGSSFASNSPTLFAGSRVLLRRLVPRHPPRTLSSLSIPTTTLQTRSSRSLPLHEDPKLAFTRIPRTEPELGSLDEISRTSLTYSVDKVRQTSHLDRPEEWERQSLNQWVCFARV